MDKYYKEEDTFPDAHVDPVPSAPAETDHAHNDSIIARFTDGDTNNPRNWSMPRRILATFMALTSGLAGGWASANDSLVIPQMQATFGTSLDVESLSTGLYLVGFGIGSLFSGPFSETAGRNPVYLISLACLMVSLAVCGAAPDVETQLVFRFFAGLFGCVSITTGGGTLADLWAPIERGAVFTVWSACNFSFVFLAPVVSGFIGESPHVSWRWSEWVALLIAGLSILVLSVAPETHGPTILSWKAGILRQNTGDERHRSELDLKLEPLSRKLLRSTWRPFAMLFGELSVLLFAMYLLVLWVVAFTFLTGYTFIFGDIYHLSQGQVGLCFLGLVVGILICAALALPVLSRSKHRVREAEQKGLPLPPPEDRLWIAIFTAPCLPTGLFWMAWTSQPSISFWCCLSGSVMIGIAFLGALIASYLYLIDVFEARAASALSGAACVRYVAAGVMTPVSVYMYRNIGVHWTLTVLGCVSVLLTPVPLLLWKFGPAIRRQQTTSAPTTDVALDTQGLATVTNP